MKLPSRFASILFSLIVSLTMSCIVAGISTFSTISLSNDFFMSWIVAWGKSWPIAFPILLTVVPMARKLVNVFLDPSSRFEPIIFALFVSIMMTFVISGVSTHSAISFSKGFIASWMSAWGMSWVVTYPIQLIVLPMAQKLVSICILPPDFPNQSPHA
tara:strand:- start:112 stop:585 length:474 start_codon:yes stop_codon:yes gene_type:complete